MNAGPPKQERALLTVIVVDDDDFFRARIQSWLGASQRFQCVGSFADGETALSEILVRPPALAIVDYALPGLKGDEVIWRRPKNNLKKCVDKRSPLRDDSPGL